MPARRHHHYDALGLTYYDGVAQRFESRYVVWHCPNCTWYRFRTNTEDWEKSIIQHPLYGFITNYQCYERDIETHNCMLTRDARIRIGVDPDKPFGDYKYDKERDRQRGRNYEEFSDDLYTKQ